MVSLKLLTAFAAMVLVASADLTRNIVNRGCDPNNSNVGDENDKGDSRIVGNINFSRFSIESAGENSKVIVNNNDDGGSGQDESRKPIIGWNSKYASNGYNYVDVGTNVNTYNRRSIETEGEYGNGGDLSVDKQFGNQYGNTKIEYGDNNDGSKKTDKIVTNGKRFVNGVNKNDFGQIVSNGGNIFDVKVDSNKNDESQRSSSSSSNSELDDSIGFSKGNDRTDNSDDTKDYTNGNSEDVKINTNNGYLNNIGKLKNNLNKFGIRRKGNGGGRRWTGNIESDVIENGRSDISGDNQIGSSKSAARKIKDFKIKTSKKTKPDSRPWQSYDQKSDSENSDSTTSLENRRDYQYGDFETEYTNTNVKDAYEKNSKTFSAYTGTTGTTDFVVNNNGENSKITVTDDKDRRNRVDGSNGNSRSKKSGRYDKSQNGGDSKGNGVNIFDVKVDSNKKDESQRSSSSSSNSELDDSIGFSKGNDRTDNSDDTKDYTNGNSEDVKINTNNGYLNNIGKLKNNLNKFGIRRKGNGGGRRWTGNIESDVIENGRSDISGDNQISSSKSAARKIKDLKIKTSKKTKPDSRPWQSYDQKSDSENSDSTTSLENRRDYQYGDFETEYTNTNVKDAYEKNSKTFSAYTGTTGTTDFVVNNNGENSKITVTDDKDRRNRVDGSNGNSRSKKSGRYDKSQNGGDSKGNGVNIFDVKVDSNKKDESQRSSSSSSNSELDDSIGFSKGNDRTDNSDDTKDYTNGNSEDVKINTNNGYLNNIGKLKNNLNKFGIRRKGNGGGRRWTGNIESDVIENGRSDISGDNQIGSSKSAARKIKDLKIKTSKKTKPDSRPWQSYDQKSDSENSDSTTSLENRRDYQYGDFETEYTNTNVKDAYEKNSKTFSAYTGTTGTTDFVVNNNGENSKITVTDDKDRRNRVDGSNGNSRSKKSGRYDKSQNGGDSKGNGVNIFDVKVDSNKKDESQRSSSSSSNSELDDSIGFSKGNDRTDNSDDTKDYTNGNSEDVKINTNNGYLNNIGKLKNNLNKFGIRRKGNGGGRRWTGNIESDVIENGRSDISGDNQIGSSKSAARKIKDLKIKTSKKTKPDSRPWQSYDQKSDSENSDSTTSLENRRDYQYGGFDDKDRRNRVGSNNVSSRSKKSRRNGKSQKEGNKGIGDSNKTYSGSSTSSGDLTKNGYGIDSIDNIKSGITRGNGGVDSFDNNDIKVKNNKSNVGFSKSNQRRRQGSQSKPPNSAYTGSNKKNKKIERYDNGVNLKGIHNIRGIKKHGKHVKNNGKVSIKKETLNETGRVSGKKLNRPAPRSGFSKTYRTDKNGYRKKDGETTIPDGNNVHGLKNNKRGEHSKKTKNYEKYTYGKGSRIDGSVGIEETKQITHINVNKKQMLYMHGRGSIKNGIQVKSGVVPESNLPDLATEYSFSKSGNENRKNTLKKSSGSPREASVDRRIIDKQNKMKYRTKTEVNKVHNGNVIVASRLGTFKDGANSRDSVFGKVKGTGGMTNGSGITNSNESNGGDSTHLSAPTALTFNSAYSSMYI